MDTSKRFITGSVSIRRSVIELPPSSINCTEKLPDIVSGKLLPDQANRNIDEQMQPQNDGDKFVPVPAMRLRDFLQALEKFHDPNRRCPYYRLSPLESVVFMLTGKGDARALAWLRETGQNPDYRLRLFDAMGDVVKIDADALQQGADLPEDLYVKLDNVALFFCRMEGRGVFFLRVPWCSMAGELIGLRDAQHYVKPAYIGYLQAKWILRRRFPDTSEQEISLWLKTGELSAWQHEFASAGKVDYAGLFRSMETGSMVIPRTLPTLSDILIDRYFYQDDVEGFLPRIRWRTYQFVIELGRRYQIEKESMDAIIRRDWQVGALTFQRHSPQGPDDGNMQVLMPNLEAQLYPSDWINRIIQNDLKPHRAGLQKGTDKTEGCPGTNETDKAYILDWESEQEALKHTTENPQPSATQDTPEAQTTNEINRQLYPMKELKNENDWFLAIRDAAGEFEKEFGYTPSKLELWLRLKKSPPMIYGITWSEAKRSLDLDGNPLDRNEFSRRYKRYWPTSPSQ